MMMLSKNTALDLRGLALVVVIGAWLAGILLEAWTSLPAFALFAAACAALIFIIPLWRDHSARLIMCSILLLLLGAWRCAIASPIGDPQAISAFIGPGKLEVRGAVTDEPKLLGRSRTLLVAVNSVSKNGGTSWQDAHGQLEVQMLDGGGIENPYGPNYGDNVELQGKLQPPTSYSPPSVFASMAFPRIAVSNTGGNPIIAALYHLRTTLAVLISQSLPQPEAALQIAILLGVNFGIAIERLWWYFGAAYWKQYQGLLLSLRTFPLTSWTECSRGLYTPGGVCWSLVLSSDPPIKSRTSKQTVHFI